jgi:sugar lactone lactonase YvrE
MGKNEIVVSGPVCFSMQSIKLAGETIRKRPGNSRVEKWETEPTVSYASSFGSYGSGSGELLEPEGGLAADASGDVWVSDTENSRLEEFNSKGEFVRTVGSGGQGAGQFETTYGLAIDSKGDIWASDLGGDRVEEFTAEGTFIKMFGWGVATGGNKLEVCTSSCRSGLPGAGNGQFQYPEGITVDSKGDLFVADRGNKRVQEFNSELAWVRNISLSEEKDGPFYVAVDASGDLWVTYSWENKVGEFSSEGKLIRTWGEAGPRPGQLGTPYGIAIGPEGNVWLTEYTNNRVQVFTPAGEYLYGFGGKGSAPGQFNYSPNGIAFHGSNIYVLDSGPEWENTGNSRIEKWQTNQETSGSENAHDKQMVYYTGEANAKFPACGGHLEWEGMPCETLPATQPGTSGVPPLPVTTVTSYNIWGEPETTEEAFGSTTRTRKASYDEAGRISTAEETSSADTALPKVAYVYNEATGQLVEQSTTAGEEKQTITSHFDRLGRLTSYTDADKNTTTYEYEPSGDGRPTSVSDEKGSQSYAYDPTTGELTKLLDSSAKTFTASYDVEQNMTSETYPNGMTATYTVDPAGETTGIEYVKTTHCTEKCVWFSETTVPSIHGETLVRTSTLATETYGYDAVGRLLQTTETPTEKGCVTRIYAYDEDSNRTSLTTRAPAAGNKCATEGGTTETHTYDSGDRLTDSGVSYDPLGDITKLPAADAGGYELTTAYYTDGQVQKQSQNAQTNTYSLDPAGRIRKTVAEGTTKLTTISHYGGPGEALTWKEEGEKTGKYTRLIPGIDGTLTATEASGQEAVLQLHDLQGDVVATAGLSETETKLLSPYNSTEFGVPVNGTPPTKYSWLGAEAVSSELSSGTLITGTVSYVPQLGRPLQTVAVVPPGVAVNGAEGIPYIAQASAWSIDANTATGEEDAHEYEATLEEAAKREAEEKACAIASMCTPPEENIYVDPVHDFYFTSEEALDIGDIFVIGGLAVKEELEELLGPVGTAIGDLASNVVDHMGNELIGCGQAIGGNQADGGDRCRLRINTQGVWTPFGTIDTYVPTDIKIVPCFYYKKKTGKFKRGLNCA